MLYDFLLKHVATLFVHCHLHFYEVLTTIIIGVFAAYAVWKYRFEDPHSNDVKVSSPRISFAWTASTARTCRQRSPEIVHPNLGQCHLEIFPVGGAPGVDPAFEVYFIVKNWSVLQSLWKNLPFWRKPAVQIGFRISVLSGKRCLLKCVDNGVKESCNELVVGEEIVYLKSSVNRFGPFTLDRDVLNKYSTETNYLIFMVGLIISGNGDSELACCENFIHLACSRNEKIETGDEDVIESNENEDPKIIECESPSVAELMKLRDLLKEVLRNSEYSDLKITIGTRTFCVHKAVLAVGCPSILSKLSTDENEVRLEGVDPDVFGAVLEFIYSREIDEGLLDFISGDLLRVAVRLKLEDLKTLSEKSLLKTLNTANVAERVQIAYECESTPIKEPILQFINSHRKEMRGTSPEWQSVLRCPWSKEILFDLLNLV